MPAEVMVRTAWKYLLWKLREWIQERARGEKRSRREVKTWTAPGVSRSRVRLYRVVSLLCRC
jgi:hypothetical protein